MPGVRRSATLSLVVVGVLGGGCVALAEPRGAQGRPTAGPVVVAFAPAVPDPAPDVAPGPALDPAPGPAGPPSAPQVPAVAPAVPGPLPGRPSDRGLGLALAVAAVLVVGAASLLLRLLLALPVLSDRGARL